MMQSQRALRLVRLREQQHLLTAMHLRTAQQSLLREDEALDTITRRAQGARADFDSAQQPIAVHDWLLACASTELDKLAAAHHNARRAIAQQAMHEASQHEAAARTASRQMEHTLEKARRTERRTASHEEQLCLDEAARNLKAFTNNTRVPRSLF